MNTKTAITPPGWYIVRTRPNFEMQAGEEILGIGQTVYVPQFRKEYRHHRSKAWVTKYLPLMPGYLFVMTSRHWSRTLSCPGVLRILRNQWDAEEGVPIRIDDGVVQEMRARQEDGDFDELRLHGRIDAGTEVKIAGGPLSGLKGVTADIGDRNIVMMIQMFGQQIKAKVPIERLQRAG